jgi:hypothetical protein
VRRTEEAVLNALAAAKAMVGRDGRKAIALPHDRLRKVLRKYNRLAEPGGGRKKTAKEERGP